MYDTHSLLLLAVFTACAFVYGWSTRRLVKLDKLRLEKEPPPLPDATLGAATEFAKRMGLTIAPGNDELKAFCERNGHGIAYRNANRWLYGSIIVAFVCLYFLVKGGTLK